MKKIINKKNNSNNLPMILVVLDGWGIDKANKGNAVSLSQTPVMDKLIKNYPNTKLYAHGRYVGLPRNQVGNSEAGHMNIGAGTLVVQDSVKISESIDDGTFYKNSAFLGAFRHIRKMNSKLHIMGMLSNGQSPHSDPKHLIALLNLAKKNKIEKVYLHLFTDGRDSPQYASLKLVDELEKHFFNSEIIATIMGRYYAMDRKKKWVNTKMAYEALTQGVGRRMKNAQDAIIESYSRGESDEFIEPYMIGDSDKSRIEEGDSVIFFNLRSDRGRQLAKVFVQNDFTKMNPGSFERKKMLKHLYFVAMTDFGPDLDDILTAFPSINLQCTLPTELSDLRQLYIAETEKYAHVTYFFNGGYSGVVSGEHQEMVNSPDVKSYSETPAMSSKELTKIILSNNKKRGKENYKYDFTVLNFAAPDMIGHTGNIKAAVECCENVDDYLGQIVDSYLAIDGTILVTADHGNIEKMLNLDTNEVYTEHTVNQVPFIIVSNELRGKKIQLRTGGVLGDIAPTIIKLLNRKQPKEMKGKSLI